MSERVTATVALGAIERNVARLREAAGGAEVCAVVKGDGYGHGAEQAARAALAGGATWLGLNTAQEAHALREAGIGARLLVLGVLTEDETRVALAAGADVVAWREAFVERLVALGAGARVHVKLDTGMGRLGTRFPAEADRVAEAVLAAEGLELAGLMTHFATADDRDDPFLDEQLARFRAWATPWKARRPELVLHAANSAALLREPAARLDLVRPGVAIYGLDPFGVDPGAHGLEPALRLTSYLAEVKPIEPGESAGYGRRFVAGRPTTIGVVPIGYGDGWRRGLTNNAEVVLGRGRVPLVGTVSMDSLTVDLGPDAPDRVGDEVVLLGDGLGAEEVAARLGTINYEVTCGLLPRVPRRYVA